MLVNISKESPSPSVPYLTYFHSAGGWYTESRKRCQSKSDFVKL